MHFRWLGWAGVELEAADGSRLVLDPLADAAAVFAVAGDAVAGMALPEIAAPAPGRSVAAAITHLHRDHADAAAIAAALTADAPLLVPDPHPGPDVREPSLRQAIDELRDIGLEPQLKPLHAWQQVSADPFTLTALPAVDGLGHPQVSWAIEADGQRIFHGGDTMYHGWWWRTAAEAGPFDAAFLPINGAVLNFPFAQPPSPLPAALTPEQAVAAGRALRARTAVPIHHSAYDNPFYDSIRDAPQRFAAAAADAGLEIIQPQVGETHELGNPIPD